MCGIAGAYKTKAPVEYMTYKLRHRGTTLPDVKQYDDLTVGFTRLAITGGDEGSQPVEGERYVVWMNGQVYNFKEWSTSKSDTVAVLEWFEKHGIKPQKFNGMFVILVYDKLTKTPYLIRDRFGIKQVYYKKHRDAYIFASEPKALEPNGVNEFALAQFRIFLLTLGNETIHKGIYKLEKATIFNLRTGWKEKYFDYTFGGFEGTYTEAKEQLSYLLKRAVQSMDKGAALLSGGVDSGTIVSLMDDPYTFTVSMDGELDESENAKRMSRGKHYSIYLRAEDRERYIDKTVYHLDDPRLSASWVNYAVYGLASKFSNVVLEGAGGDELFMGYTWRYGVNDYYDIINKTGLHDKLVEEMFRDMWKDGRDARRRFDIDNFLEGLFIVSDRMSMAHTVESRVPFMDNDLFDFAVSLPVSFVYNKKILKDVSTIPQDIKLAKKKGFSSPEYAQDKLEKQREWVRLLT